MFFEGSPLNIVDPFLDVGFSAQGNSYILNLPQHHPGVLREVPTHTNF